MFIEVVIDLFGCDGLAVTKFVEWYLVYMMNQPFVHSAVTLSSRMTKIIPLICQTCSCINLSDARNKRNLFTNLTDINVMWQNEQSQ